MISQVGNRDIVFQESIATALNRRFNFPYFYYLFLVLGIPHPAVNTRDVALYQPFRNALKLPNQLVRLPTLTFHLMGRRCQEGQQNPVRLLYILTLVGTELIFKSLDRLRQPAGKCARGYGPVPFPRQRVGDRDTRWPVAVGPSAKQFFPLLFVKTSG